MKHTEVQSIDQPRVRGEPIAIVGMRGRFPGANDLDTYWKNLAEGVESISILSQQEMRASGIPDHISRLPGYVNASPVLDGIDQFDAQFFGFSARDASLTDPQHRLFLETAWEALEDAGYDPESFPGPIGVFGGAEMSTYLYHLSQNQDALKYIDGMQLMVTNDKDHLCTQVSYRLNLRGPSITVQTTCSTSLVAISMACESLHHHRCDMALAGGVTVRVPQRGGYYYAPGSILSPDGHCRPFDVNAQGTIVGSGVGIVVLRRLVDALEENDNIRAVILGTGINNDGNDKVGYTAPSSRGQSEAIRAAHRMSGISPDSIGYVEAHGTGTILGDPIEISALTEVFRASTKSRGFCGIGSVKSNFGHLSCAAGVAGLIKTVLSLEHGAIPPTVHYTAPNPAIDLAASPFYVTKKLSSWERNGTPRRAGVSSFGVGGTNAHLVIEEAPAPVPSKPSRSFQLLTISARSEAVLNRMGDRLADHLEAHPEIALSDVAGTLHLGRRAFRFRRAVLSAPNDRTRAIAALRESREVPAEAAPQNRSVVFMFPGQGSQHPGMAEDLYNTEPLVKSIIDRCASILKGKLQADIRGFIFPSAKKRENAAEILKDTKWAQPALFTISYALASLWQSWGVRPAVMIGHSVGEYVAATLAGVLDLEDALTVISRRGQLISSLPRGSMLAVLGGMEDVQRFATGEVSLGAINAPGFYVLSGPTPAIDLTEQALVSQSIFCRRLHTSHAFHSAMMDPILAEFGEVMARVSLHRPSQPFVATLTGKMADGDVATPAYWTSQLRHAVRFGDGLRLLAEGKTPAGKSPIFLEVGAGNALSTFVRSTAKETSTKLECLTSLPATDSSRSDGEEMLASLGSLWVAGVPVEWQAIHGSAAIRRVSLPTYPFERQSYWIGAHPDATTAVVELRDTSKWMYKSVWVSSSFLSLDGASLKARRFVVFDAPGTAGSSIIDLLRGQGATILVVRPGNSFAKLAESSYELDPREPEGYRNLAIDVCLGDDRLAGVIDCWNATPPTGTKLDDAASTTLLGPMRFAHALSSQQTVRPLPVLFVARGTALVHPQDALDPPRAMQAGVAKVLPQEHPGLRVAHIDVDDDVAVPSMIAAELAATLPEPAVAMRGGLRFVETYVPLPTVPPKAPLDLPEKPVVLITGGLGHMGLHLAEAMFSGFEARLVLVGRTTVPLPTEWAAASQDSSVSEAQREIFKRLAEMRAKRDEVLVLKADLNRGDEVSAAVDAAYAHFGQVDLVVHGAARIDAAAFASVADTGPEVIEAQFSPKIRGLFHLMSAFTDRPPKRWVLHSSVSAILGGLGLAVYAGVNALLDVLAMQQGENWLSIDWDAWDNAAEAQSVSMPLAINPPEGSDALLRLLSSPVGSRALVAVNLFDRLKAWVRHNQGPETATAVALELHPRPNLPTAFVEPRSETERILAEIWGRQLGLSSVGIHDRFFDLGGHSLLAARVAAEICDRFQIELPVLKLFQVPSIGELAVLVEKAQAGEIDSGPAGLPVAATTPDESELQGDAPAKATKASYREFYNDVTRRLAQSGVGDASFFLNYGYISLNGDDESCFEVPERVFNRNSVRLAFELIGDSKLEGQRVLDVGCGRGGTVALMAETFGAKAVGVDLSPEAVAFCRRTHRQKTKFEVGDSENLPFKNCSFDVVTNLESSHTYPNLRAFFAEVSRVLKKKGRFLYTDLLPTERWLEVRALLGPLGLTLQVEREITANVLASCDDVAATRAQAFGGHEAMIDNFLAVPGSVVYEQMKSGAWEYRILRAERQ
jgi:phthiocerol/phenolphthiocerol synthesis type-I polyketide synthase E